MALKKCNECNYMVSDQAEKCPHCGAPIKRSEKVREIYQKVFRTNRNNQSPEEAKKNFEKFMKDNATDRRDHHQKEEPNNQADEDAKYNSVEQTNKAKIGNKSIFWIVVLLMCTVLVILPLFGEKWFGPPERGRVDIAQEQKIQKDLIELQMRNWLNERAQEKGLDRKCSSVSLVRESINKYIGFAEFDNGDQIDVEAIMDGNDVLFRAKPLISFK